MAVNGKAILVDATKCFACRSCQVACKQWNDLPAEAETPKNLGTYENPPDLSHTQWLLVHFKEVLRDDGSLAWNFVRNSCRHCLDAPCKQAAKDPDAILVDEATGAVLFQEKTRDEDFDTLLRACPFDIPRRGPDGMLHKCVMCVDRVQNGETTACAKACPSDAIEFGDRDDMLAAAKARVAVLRDSFPDATVLDHRDVRLLIVLGDRESLYKLRVSP